MNHWCRVALLLSLALCVSSDANPQWFWSIGKKSTIPSTTVPVRNTRATNAAISSTKPVETFPTRRNTNPAPARILAGPKTHETFIFSQQEAVHDPGLSQQDIPFDLLQRMSDVEDVNEFLQYVTNVTLIKMEGRDPMIIGSWEDPIAARTAGSGRDASVTTAKLAKCMPELQTVELVRPTDPTVFYYPTCTRIERCGGCCSSELLTCEPTRTEMVNLQVIKTQYTGGDKMKFAGNEIVPVEKHLSCKCVCRIKETDCHSLQTYVAGSCRCECKNVEDREKCLLESPMKVWDPAECACKCKEQGYCSTGFYFDQQTCNCEVFNLRKGIAGTNVDAQLQRQKRPVKTELEETAPDSRDKMNKPYVSFEFDRQKKIRP